MVRADWVADEEILHFAAAVDEDRGRIVVQEPGGFVRFQVFHGGEFNTRNGGALGSLVGPL
jgi:hypothetical protein